MEQMAWRVLSDLTLVSFADKAPPPPPPPQVRVVLKSAEYVSSIVPNG